MKITIKDCFNKYSISSAALEVVNKIIFLTKKAYTTAYDEKTYYDFGSNIVDTVNAIEGELRRKTFKFQPTKQIRKKAKLNKVRDIYLSTWKDKIVETWLNKSLNKLLNYWFTKNSYAYRTDDLGLDSCQNSISKEIQTRNFFVKRDISKYFYSIDKDILIKQLEELVNKDDYLFQLLKERIFFKYINKKKELLDSELGIPFGSPLACTLSNIHLTHIDKGIRNFNVKYYRYADDILIMGSDPEEVLKAAEYFDSEVGKLNLQLKESYKQAYSWEEHPGFQKVTKFTHLGLEYCSNRKMKFAVEKQRKIINFVKRELKRASTAIRKEKKLDKKIELAIEGVNNVLETRIRSAAITDYYLKHVNDENQLKMMDRIITEMVISTVLSRPFKKKLFRIVPYKKLRDMGLPSLVHRNKLFKHGHLKVQFLSLHNKILHDRHDDMLKRREERIMHMKISKKIRKEKALKNAKN